MLRIVRAQRPYYERPLGRFEPWAWGLRSILSCSASKQYKTGDMVTKHWGLPKLTDFLLSHS